MPLSCLYSLYLARLFPLCAPDDNSAGRRAFTIFSRNTGSSIITKTRRKSQGFIGKRLASTNSSGRTPRRSIIHRALFFDAQTTRALLVVESSPDQVLNHTDRTRRPAGTAGRTAPKQKGNSLKVSPRAFLIVSFCAALRHQVYDCIDCLRSAVSCVRLDALSARGGWPSATGRVSVTDCEAGSEDWNLKKTKAIFHEPCEDGRLLRRMSCVNLLYFLYLCFAAESRAQD